MKHFFKKQLRALWFFPLMMSVFLSAKANFEVNGIYYYINSEENKTVSVVSYTIGENYNDRGELIKYSGDINIPSKVSFDNIEYTVNKIGDIWGHGLTSVHIPATITEIKGRIFEEIYSLNDEPIPSSEFTTINVAEDNEFFSSFDGALYNKDKSKLIKVPSGKNSIIFSDNLKKIESIAFEGSQIENLTLPETLNELGNGVFMNSFIKTLSIPNSVTVDVYNFNLGEPEFIETIFFPANVLDKRAELFNNFLLTEGYVPSTFELISPKTFKQMHLNGESKYFTCENGMLYSKDKSALYLVPSKLDNLSFSPSLKVIKKEAFWYFTGVPDLKLPEGIIEIDTYHNFEFIESLTIPSTVKKFSGTFSTINGLSVYLLPLNPPELDGYSSLSKVQLYVYPSALSAYQNAENWNYYSFQTISDFTSKGIISAEDCEILKDKNISLNINLKNYDITPVQYSGFQFDVEMPDGLTITDVKLSDELVAAGFAASNSEIEGNPVRVISYKTNGSGVSSTDGIVTLTIKADANTTEGDKTIKFTNAKLSSTGGSSMPLDDSSVTVTVKGLPVTAIDISYESGKQGDLYVDDTAVYQVTVTPSDASDKTVTWSIEDPAVASITTGEDNSKVTVKALKIGETTLKATANDGSETVGSVNIKVVATPISSVTISSQDGKTSIYPEETLALTATVNPTTATMPITYKWTSDSPDVATVTDNSANVTITAIKPGAANITVVATNQAGNVTSEKFKVTVAPRPITSVTLSEEGPLTLNLYDLKEITISATVNPSNATDPVVTWKSEKPEIATVEDGKITAVSLGTTVITATASNDAGEQTKSITVNVVATSAKNITISGDKHDLKVTEELQLHAEVSPAETTYPEVEWTSSDNTKASVDNTGKVTAKATGQVSITATVKATPEVKANYDITIAELVKGDANDDGNVDVADVVTIALKSIEIEPDNWCLIAADFNKNGEADEEDVTAAVNLILGAVGTRAIDDLFTIKDSGDKLMVNSFNDETTSSKVLKVNLNNTYDYAALKADVVLPPGVSVENVSLGNKTSDHVLSYNVTSDNILKFIIYSLKNTPLIKDNDHLLTIELNNVSAFDEISVENITASTSLPQRYSLGSENVGTAGINDILNDHEGLYRVFTIQGLNILNTSNPQDLNNLENGLYIINGQKVLINK